jgi:pilus assembly protein CpaB
MKWSIVALIALGLIAAISATLLVNALRVDDTARSAKGDVDAVIVVKTLPAMAVISSHHVVVQKVPQKGLSPDYCSNPIQVIGKVLSVPVVGGQVLTKSLLITEGSGAQLAAALPFGMRALSVPVANYSVMSGLLYPGCVVDVIATFRLRSGNPKKGQAVSMTLLHSIQVLAIQDESIVSKSGSKDEAAKKMRGRSSSSTKTVTLMVDTKQVEALQLAMGYGKITLAMRNPLDQRPVSLEATVLSQGRLAQLGDLLGTSVFAAEEESSYPDVNDLNVIEMAGLTGDPNRPIKTAAVRRRESDDRLRQLFETGSSRSRSQWEITVIRGREVSEEVIELGESQ